MSTALKLSVPATLCVLRTARQIGLIRARSRSLMVEWGNGAERASNDADVSIAPSKIPYGGFSPVRLQGQHVE